LVRGHHMHVVHIPGADVAGSQVCFGPLLGASSISK
jgi:hypothetical protein